MSKLIINQEYYNIDEINKCVKDLLKIQTVFKNNYGIEDIFSNSKFYEIIIANQFNHSPIPGHSGSRDAKDKNGNEYEYKHFKETSSNHSWTFNDYTDHIISGMHKYTFIFAHINDKDYKYPGIMDWYFNVDGKIIQDYLKKATLKIKNNRKMINVSVNQLESLGLQRTMCNNKSIMSYSGNYKSELTKLSNISLKLEEITGISKILTSNKLYELLVAIELKHFVNSEQGGRDGAHDAYDYDDNTYEYKVYKSRTWSFQDISKTVLKKYYNDKLIICAVVDKENLLVKEIYSITPKDAIPLLDKKLKEKIKNLKQKGKELRRKQVSLSLNDIKKLPSFQKIK